MIYTIGIIPFDDKSKLELLQIASNNMQLRDESPTIEYVSGRFEVNAQTVIKCSMNVISLLRTVPNIEFKLLLF